MNHVAVAYPVLVQVVLEQGRIRQAGHQFFAGHVINKNLVRAAGGGVLTIRRYGDRVDGVQPLGQRRPFHRARSGHLPLGALSNPQLQQAELLRRKVLGGRLVLGRRHGRIVHMRGKQKQNALVGLARHYGIRFHDILRCLEDEIRLGLGAVVAGEAIGSQER